LDLTLSATKTASPFLPARAALLADYWQKTVDKIVEKWRLAEVDYFSAFNDFGGFFNTPNYPNPYLKLALPYI
jgi:hypothetical protein